LSPAASKVISRCNAGDAAAWVKRSSTPSNIRKLTNTPTATKAISLTTDSKAMAATMPSWCSVASM